MKRLLPLLVFSLAATTPAQLTSAERKGVGDALFIGNMSERDLEYERRPFNDKYRLALTNLALDKPLDAADMLMRLHQSGQTKSLAAAIRSARGVLGDPASLTIVNAGHPSDRSLHRLPSGLREPIKKLVDAVNDCNGLIKRATAQLRADEARYLIEALPLYANEEPSIKFGYTSRVEYDAKRVLALIDKIDLVGIRAAGEMLASRVEALRPKLEHASQSAFNLKLTINGLRVDVSGTGDDVHDDKDAAIVVDLGGNETYRGRAGAGVGYAAVLIDLGGNDTFDLPDLNAGAGILGVGLVYDIGGHDSFRCKSLSLGCGLAGVGGFYREGGKDTYESVSLAEGFGEFGLGIMIDTAGDDRYDGAFNVQGAARTGGVGWLIDLGGDDAYRAGGLVLNSPLFEKVHYSNAQGYGSGYREDTGGTSGGIGLLTDFAGDDQYVGETYCQAASYWFSIGSLYDSGGNDTYTAYHYAQASAMHMTGAYLFDLAGDDAYIVKLGACHAIGHDYGVAFLLDRAGMDLYAAHDSRPATGNANGLAIFIDAAGDDRYFGPVGAGNAARGSGSLAIFCDLGGTDKYADGLADGQATTRDTWAVALDGIGNASSTGGPAIANQEKPVPGSQTMPGDAEMQKIYAKATQWGVGTAQQEVADNIARLIAIGKPALQWMMDKRLATADRLQIRAFVAVINGIGAEGRQLIAPKVGSDSVEESRIALRIATDANVKEAAPFLPAALAKPALQRQAAAAAGALGSRESIPALQPLTLSQDRLTALNAVVALGALADISSLSTAEALLSSPELPIRKAAISLIAKFPNEGTDIAKRSLANSDERLSRSGVEILGAIGSTEALGLIGRLIGSGGTGLRISALLALNGRVPQEYRTAVLDARKDNDPLVRAVALRIDLGR